jgi:uncharacterized membrane protein
MSRLLTDRRPARGGAWQDAPVTDSAPARIHWFYPALIIVLGAVGWWAAYNLTIDKFIALEHPTKALSCDLNPFVQCSKNLDSWQGSLFGFPNPILGLGGFVAPIAVGVAILAGASFARWFWRAFHIGVAGAFAFVVFLLTQSFYAPNLGTLCPWCLLVWTVVYPLIVSTTGVTLANGVWGEHARGAGRFILRWAPLIVIVMYVIVAALAQARFGLIQYFLG